MFFLVFLEGESKSHRLQVYLLPLEGVRGVEPSLGEGLGGLFMPLSASLLLPSISHKGKSFPTESIAS